MLRKTAFVSAAVFVSALPAIADEPSKDLAKIQGTWTVKAMQHNGTDVPEDARKAITIIVKDDKLTFMGPMAAPADAKEKPEFPEFRITLDAAKTPKAIDLNALNGSHKGKTALAIYLIDGDELKLCVPNDPASKDRPKEFISESKPMSNVVLTLQRTKAGK